MRIFTKLVKLILSVIESTTHCWITYIVRPRRGADFGSHPDTWGGVENGDIAIVMQGPVLEKWNFTIETIKMYQIMYPGVHIIVSTWHDTKDSIVVRMRDLGVYVVLSEYPNNPGISHVNYQIASTKAGIQKAKQLGCIYCLKTRTDQRMYQHDALQLLRSMLVEFRPADGYSQLQGRLIGISLNTYKYRLYGISDMFMFGYMEDMHRYWNVPLDERKPFRCVESNLLKYAQNRVCEVYFCALFLEGLGVKLEWTLKHSWQVYIDLFCIVDQSMVGLYWPKYNRFIEHRRLDYSQRKVCELLQFSNWLTLHTIKSLDDKAVPEDVLQCGIGDTFRPKD